MSVATHRKGRRVAAARYPHQAVRGSPGVGGQRPPSTHKAPNLLWFHYSGYFQLYLDNDLFTVGTYGTLGTALLPACTGTAVYPPHLATQAKIAVKATVKATATPLRRPEFLYRVGVERLASLRRSTAIAFALCVGHAPTTARAQDDEIARRALAVRCGRGRRAHSRQAQLRRPLSCVYKK